MQHNNVVFPLPVIIAMVVLCAWGWVMTEDYNNSSAVTRNHEAHASR